MEVGQQSLLEREYPYHTPECCPECGTEVDLRTALCGDETNPLRRIGCTNCGLWLVRNKRTRTQWRPLLAWGSVLFVVIVAARIFARENLHWGWASLIDFVLLMGTLLVLVPKFNERYVTRIGPPWIPADGERADLSR